MQPATLAQAESIEDGYVRLVGHNKNLFIWGGDNNEPEEIVQPLDDVHGVLEVGFGASGAISLSL